LTVTVDTKDDPMDSKNPNSDEMILDHISRDRRSKGEGEISSDGEELRGRAEVVVKATGHHRATSGSIPVGLGNPDGGMKHSGNQRPNNWAMVVFKNERLKAHTRAITRVVVPQPSRM
jgi:hypothetical protein